MRLDPAEARRRFANAPVARLATVGPDGAPHVVPICFAIVDDTVFSAVDDKPKSTAALRRLENIAAESRTSLLADHYDEDWTSLWWVRADGHARVARPGERDDAIMRLRVKYSQYASHRLGGPVIAVDVEVWLGWSAG